MNAKYGRLADGQVEYAPDAIVTEGGIKVNPSEASYLAAGWKKVVDDPPAPEEGCDVAVTAWAEDATTITAVYKQVPRPVTEPEDPPEGSGGGNAVPGSRVFSKLKLVVALKEADKWVLVKTWLEEKSYYDYFLAAQDFAEDYPLFRECLEALKRYANLSDETVEEVLARCVAD